MKKREITKAMYEYQKQELSYFEKNGAISAEQKERMLDFYVVKAQQSIFLRFILTFGAVLLGLGVLSFVASNWTDMTKVLKIMVLTSSMMTMFLVGWKMEKAYPKTARSLHYVGLLIYGASIFLMGQIFHFGGDSYEAFLLWGVGVLVVGRMLKDRLLIGFSAILILGYGVNYSLDENSFPWLMLLGAVLLYATNREVGYSKVLDGLNMTISLALFYIAICLGLDKIELLDDATYIVFLFGFLSGLLLLYSSSRQRDGLISRIAGQLLIAINGFILTFEMVWDSQGAAFVFSFLFLLFVFYQIKKGSITNILVAGIIVLRYYMDISFDFMPKSMVFIVGGTLFIGMGYFFEKQRRKRGESDEME